LGLEFTVKFALTPHPGQQCAPIPTSDLMEREQLSDFAATMCWSLLVPSMVRFRWVTVPFGGGVRIFGFVKALATASSDLQQALLRALRDVKDFPTPGVVFKDFGPVWATPGLNRRIIDEVSHQIQRVGVLPDFIAGVESRGFIYGMAIADAVGIPFIPIRKVGKLPGKTHRLAYQLEYGEDELECQAGLIPEKASVLIHDDVLATGGTACAAGELVENAGGTIWGFSFLLNLEKLAGRERLNKRFTNRYFHVLLNID